MSNGPSFFCYRLDRGMEKKARQLGLSGDLQKADDQNGEDFVVDDLLDFSNGDFEDEFLGAEEKLENGIDNKNQFAPLSPIELGGKTGTKEDSGSVIGSQLCVPADEVADLEWLSHFVEDSFAGNSVCHPAATLPAKSTEPEKPPVLEKPLLASPVRTRVRSKRGRTGFRFWSLSSPPLTESSSPSSSSSSSTSSSSLTADTVLGSPPQAKKLRKNLGASVGGAGGGLHRPRRCSHCQIQKTPQWRAGPMGPKTLCNACGVRYKSGRLLPEYRPACSPTFSIEAHSNNHRKVLEIRRQKEVESGSGPQSQGL